MQDTSNARVAGPALGANEFATTVCCQTIGLSDYYPFFSIFAQVSRRFTVRLKTGLLGAESGSTAK